MDQFRRAQHKEPWNSRTRAQQERRAESDSESRDVPKTSGNKNVTCNPMARNMCHGYSEVYGAQRTQRNNASQNNSFKNDYRVTNINTEPRTNSMPGRGRMYNSMSGQNWGSGNFQGYRSYNKTEYMKNEHVNHELRPSQNVFNHVSRNHSDILEQTPKRMYINRQHSRRSGNFGDCKNSQNETEYMGNNDVNCGLNPRKIGSNFASKNHSYGENDAEQTSRTVCMNRQGSVHRSGNFRDYYESNCDVQNDANHEQRPGHKTGPSKNSSRVSEQSMLKYGDKIKPASTCGQSYCASPEVQSPRASGQESNEKFNEYMSSLQLDSEVVHRENSTRVNSMHQPQPPQKFSVCPKLEDGLKSEKVASNDNNENPFSIGIPKGINFNRYSHVPVSVTGGLGAPPLPIETFDCQRFSDKLMINIRKYQFTVPTPVQKFAIPCILEGNDVMAVAQTGSGKTAAFVFPIINKLLEEPARLMEDDSHCYPRALVIEPVRELTIQIFRNFKNFCDQTGLKVNRTYGGIPVDFRVKKLMAGCDILVGSPGYLVELIKKDVVDLSALKFVVFDEADRMLDMSYDNEIKLIMGHQSMPSLTNRQTLMFSATFPKKVQEHAKKYLKPGYLFVAVGIVGGACQDVQQVLYEVDEEDKNIKLKEILFKQGAQGTWVFVERRSTVDYLVKMLKRDQFRVAGIHGAKHQLERATTLISFKTGAIDVIVVTNVVARGLDVKGVNHVINYDLPITIEEYVHRIGRTGRLGNYGKATSFFDFRTDEYLAPHLVKTLTEANQHVPVWLQLYADALKYADKRNGEDYGNERHIPFSAVDIRPKKSIFKTPVDGKRLVLEEEEPW